MSAAHGRPERHQPGTGTAIVAARGRPAGRVPR